jgi:hypothetical protein
MKLGALLTLSSDPGYGGALEILEGRNGQFAIQAASGRPTTVVEPYAQVEVTVSARWEILPQ